ncbi:MAG: hypothetical protein LBI54_03580 [Lachnospiraceae bacterium]|jgi:hypothetical protein|nr:hypothetical protein [Lachnospiraceae bacterium]
MATVVLAILLLGLRRTAYLPYFCYPHRPAYHEMYAACLPEGNNVGVLYVYDTYQIGVVMHSQVLKEAKYLQVLRYKNLDRYTDFPGDGNIILLVSGDVAASGADIARQMGAISGKTSAAVIGYAVDAEAWLLE